ncbi:MAG TPA: hypothetical protein DCO75_12290 [Fibrobacteres bacterium]|nr:hypothetical protein [Fibrobacterota bacterium]
MTAKSETLGDRSVKIDAMKQKMTPTLLIGLGGSGKEVLSRLRRMFYEKYGVVSFPIIEYLWFDTDTGDIVQKARDAIDARVQMKREDIVDASINQEVFEDMMDRLDEQFSYISSWFARDEVRHAASGGLMHGAKQIRPLGRFAFFNAYPRFYDTVRYKLKKISTIESRKETERFLLGRNIVKPEIDPDRKEVIIIGSLAGGTGSGSFIDAGFAAKWVAKNEGIGSIQTTGLFFLPSTFDTIEGVNKEVANANGYCALKELNYYLSPFLSKDEGVLLDFEWKKGEIARIASPAYELAYLLENTNRRGIPTADYTDVFQMAAEFLFLDFNESTFSIKKRSLHSNANTALGTRTRVFFDDSEYEEFFPNRFSSFGLSQIIMSTDRIRRAAAYKLCRDIVQLLISPRELAADWIDHDTEWTRFKLSEREILYALAHKGLSENYLDEFKEFWRRGITENDLAQSPQLLELISSLNSTDDEEGKKKSLDGANKILERVVDFPRIVDDAELTKRVRKCFEDINDLMKVTLTQVDESLSRGAHSGSAALKISENIVSLEKEIGSLIQTQILTYLSDYSRYGVSYAQAFLKGYVNHLEKLTKRFHECLKKDPARPGFAGPEIPGTEDLERDYFRKMMEEADNLPPLPPLFKSAAQDYFSDKYRELRAQYVSKVWKSVEKIVHDKESDVFSYIEAVFTRRFAESFLGVIDRLRRSADELLVKVDNYIEAMNEFSSRLQIWFDSYNIAREHPRNRELTFDWKEKDYEETIAKYLGVEYPIGVLRKADAFLNRESTGAKKEVAHLLEAAFLYKKHSAQDWDSFEEDLVGHAIGELTGLKPSGSIDTVIKLFNMRHGDTEKKSQVIKEVLSFAEARFQTSTSMETLVKDAETISLLGCDKNETQFCDLVAQTAERGTREFDIEKFSDDTIVFYRELIGFPAFAVKKLEKMRNDYERLLLGDDNNRFLRHIEKNPDKFPEIISADPVEARRRVKAMRPFIAGLLTKTITYSKVAKLFYLHKPDEYGINKNIPLGNDLYKCAFGCSEDQISYLERQCAAYGKVFEGWAGQGKKGLEKFYQLFVLVRSLVKELEGNGERTVLQEGLLARSIRGLLDDVQLRIWQLLKIDDINGLKKALKEDSIAARKSYPQTEEFWERIEILEKDLDRFTQKTSYTDSRTGLELRILQQ